MNYTKGLVQKQVGEVFQDIYGDITASRILDNLCEDILMAHVAFGCVLRFHRLRAHGDLS